MSDPNGGAPTSVTDVTEKFDAYFKALGHFVHSYAEAESVMLFALTTETGVALPVARAIYSGTRIKEAMNFIKRSREAKGLPAHKDLERAFAQLSLITGQRNDILHHGARFDGNSFTVSNMLRALTPERATSVEVSPEMLAAMTADLQTIKSALAAFLIEHDLRNHPEHLEPFQRSGRAPWRYKLPSPAKPPNNPQKAPSRRPKLGETPPES